MQLLEDDAQQLWFTTNKGLMSVPRAGLTRWPPAEPPCLCFKSTDLPMACALPNSTAATPPPAAARPTGCYGSRTCGIVRIDPNHVRTNTRPPSVHIEQVLADGVPLIWATEPRLPGSTAVGVSLHALSLLVPSRVLFKYRLEGSTRIGSMRNRRTAYYTRLPPGTYSFASLPATMTVCGTKPARTSTSL